jgi:hypothetical protein
MMGAAMRKHEKEQKLAAQAEEGAQLRKVQSVLSEKLRTLRKEIRRACGEEPDTNPNGRVFALKK